MEENSTLDNKAGAERKENIMRICASFCALSDWPLTSLVLSSTATTILSFAPPSNNKGTLRSRQYTENVQDIS